MAGLTATSVRRPVGTEAALTAPLQLQLLRVPESARAAATPAAPEPTTMASNKAVPPNEVLAFQEFPGGAQDGGDESEKRGWQAFTLAGEETVVFRANFGQVEENLDFLGQA